MTISIEQHIDVLWKDYFRTDVLQKREEIRLEISILELKLYRQNQRISPNVDMINIEILK